jgi:hypothetical protein
MLAFILVISKQLSAMGLFTVHCLLMSIPFFPYGRGWKSKSGKKRLNSIKMPAVIVSQIVAATGAVEINLIK